MWEKQLKLYDELVAATDKFERIGKSVPYTSANGYMFSFLNKEAEFGIRLPKDAAADFMETYHTTIFKSHSAVMKDYVLVPNSLLTDVKQLLPHLIQSFEFVMSLKPKSTKK